MIPLGDRMQYPFFDFDASALNNLLIGMVIGLILSALLKILLGA